MPSKRRFYAASHCFDRRFVYSDGGWTAFVFDTKSERDEFVDDGELREAVSRNIARKIAGSNVQEELMDGGGYRLVPANGYYNANYWS